MKRCHQCQHKNPDGANFCNNCGAKLKRSQAERRQLTILFCDLVGSTPLSEQLDPEEYRQVITDYHGVAEKVIKQHGGHIAQYLGDGLLVYFGYPKGLEDAPKAGVRAGLGILKAVARANQEWAAAGKTPIEIRIGIHTGLVVVDDHLALGETVNIAARLEGLAPHNGMVISPRTLSLVKGWFEVKSIGKQVLKGISEPMEIFQVFGETGIKSTLEAAKGRGLSPLVGRQKELDLLKGHWAKAKDGKGQILLLNGEAGIGKSRLLDAIVEWIFQESAAPHVAVRCSSYHINSAFHPLIEMLGQVVLKFESEDSTEVKLNKLEEFVLSCKLDFKTSMPLLAEFLSISSEGFPPLAISPFAKRQQTLEYLVQAFVNKASDRPIIFTFEDLHWSDASTLEWLNLFLKQVTNLPILMLCTTRPAFRPDWAEYAEVTQMNLERLTTEDMTYICHHQTEGKALPKEILEQIVRKTEGVPLFVEELTKMIMESDFLVEKSDGFELAGVVSSLDIPSTLQDSLLARLDRLSDEKDVVQMGAVLGREFSFEILKAVLPQREDRLKRSLSQLLAAEIFQNQGDGHRSVYQFKHALIQDAAYDSILKSRKQKLHHRAANVLEHQFGDITQTQPEIVAHHYTEARIPLQAIPYWDRAGNLSLTRNANLEALRHFEKGLDLVKSIEDQSRRDSTELRMLNTLGAALQMTKVYTDEEAGAVFNRSYELCQNVDDPIEQIKTLMGLFAVNLMGGTNKAAFEIAGQALEMAGRQEETLFAVMANNAMGIVCFNTGRLKKAEDHLLKVIELYDPAVHDSYSYLSWGHLNVNAGAWLLWTLTLMGALDRAEKLSKYLFEYVKRRENNVSWYHAYHWPAWQCVLRRDGTRCTAIMSQYLPKAHKYGDPWYVLTSELTLNYGKALMGNAEVIPAILQTGDVIINQIGVKGTAGILTGPLASIQLENGQLDEAFETCNRLITIIDQTGEEVFLSELFRVKGEVFLKRDKDQARAESCFLNAIKTANEQGAKLLELRSAKSLALLRQEQGMAKQGYELLKGIYDQFTEGFDSVDLVEARRLLNKLENH